MIGTEQKKHAQEKRELQDDLTQYEQTAEEMQNEWDEEKLQLQSQIQSSTEQLNDSAQTQNDLEQQIKDIVIEKESHLNNFNKMQNEQLESRFVQKGKSELFQAELEGKDVIIRNLKSEKKELTQLTVTMRNNLKNLRKVFLGQVQSGVSYQQKYLSQSRSQGSIFLDESSLQLPHVGSDKLSEDEISINLSRISISQELKNLDNEKELMTTAIAEINENQHQNTQKIQEQQQSLAAQLRETQEEQDDLVQQIADLQNQLKDQSMTFQTTIQDLKQQLKLSQEQIFDMQDNLQKEKNILLDQFQEVSQENSQNLNQIQNLEQQMESIKSEHKQSVDQITSDNQKQIEELALQLRIERTKVAGGMQLGESTSKEQYNSNKSQQDEMIKKLEYQNRQSQQDMLTYQQALTQESLQRQASEKKIQNETAEKWDLIEDQKHLKQQLEEKEDEIMIAYQDYQKKIKSKDQDLEDAMSQLETVQQQLRTLQENKQNSPAKVQITLEEEVEIQNLIIENERLSVELEKQKRIADDLLFDKDNEINTITQIVSMKDLEISQLNTKLELNKLSGKHENDLGQFFSNEEDQNDVSFHMLHRQSPKISQVNEYVDYNSQAQSAFQSQKKFDDDINIYGCEDDSQDKLGTSQKLLVQSIGASQIHIQQSLQSPSLASHVRDSSISPQPYKQQNMNINLEICKKEETSFDEDGFDFSKRVRTMNQGALVASIKNLDLAESKSSLPDKAIINSKTYKDLENRSNKLQQDLSTLSQMNKELQQQLENLNQTSPLPSNVSDNTSIMSVNEDLKVQLKSKRQQIDSMKKRVQSVERDRDNKQIMIKQLQIEMENYADQLLNLEEKNYSLEQTAEILTKQIMLLTTDGHEQASKFKSALKKQIEVASASKRAAAEEEQRQVQKKTKSFAQNSFLLPAPDDKSDSARRTTSQISKQSKTSPISWNQMPMQLPGIQDGPKKDQKSKQPKPKKTKMSMF